MKQETIRVDDKYVLINFNFETEHSTKASSVRFWGWSQSLVRNLEPVSETNALE